MNFRYRLGVMGLCSVVCLSLTVAMAQEVAHQHGPQHGGQVVEVDGHHGIEMVATDAELVFHMTDHDKPMNVSGSSFRAIIQTNDGTSILTLTADGTTLKTALKAPLPSGTKIAISGKARDGHTIQARFVMK